MSKINAVSCEQLRDGAIRVLDMDNEARVDDARDALGVIIDLCSDCQHTTIIDMHKIAVLLTLVKEKLDAVVVVAHGREVLA